MKRGKAIIKELLAALVVLSGLARATRALLWRDRVAVLLYHDPDPVTLDRHLAYLRKFCDLVPLTDVSAPSNGRARRSEPHHAPRPRARPRDGTRRRRGEPASDPDR